MPEGVEHALMAENTVGDGELIAQVGERVGHGERPWIGLGGGQESGCRRFAQASKARANDWIVTDSTNPTARALDEVHERAITALHETGESAMNPTKTFTAVAIAVIALAATIPPSEAYTQRIPAHTGAASVHKMSVPPNSFAGCAKWHPGCYHPENNHPGAPQKSGNGIPDTGINCTYTTHGQCSPQ